MQVLEKDKFAREVIAPKKGIKKSSFFEAINSRGLEQLTCVFNERDLFPAILFSLRFNFI